MRDGVGDREFIGYGKNEVHPLKQSEALNHFNRSMLRLGNFSKMKDENLDSYLHFSSFKIFILFDCISDIWAIKNILAKCQCSFILMNL